MQDMIGKTYIQKHVMTAYSPWGTEIIDFVWKEVLCASEAMIATWRLSSVIVTRLFPAYDKFINHSHLWRLGCNADRTRCMPLEYSTGLRSATIISCQVRLLKYERYTAFPESKVRPIFSLELVQEEIEHVHKDMSDFQKQSSRKARQPYNAESSIIPIFFSIVNYIIPRKKGRRSHKIHSKWQGLICTLNKAIYAVYDFYSFTDCRKETAHAHSLLRYSPMRDKQPARHWIVEQTYHPKYVYHVVEPVYDI